MTCRLAKFHEVGNTSYFISDNGVVYSSRSLHAGRLTYKNMDDAEFFRMFRPIASFNGKGYRRVRIRGENFKIHRLVATYFVPNRDYLPYVLHKDGDFTNNHYYNLVWSRTQSNQK